MIFTLLDPPAVVTGKFPSIGPMMQRSSPTTRRSKRGWAVLAISVGLLIGVWLVVLPGVARQPRVAERIRRLNDRGIDPSAIFYSELDAMSAAEDCVQRVRSAEDDPFW